MLEEANTSIKMSPLLAITEEESYQKLKQFYLEKVHSPHPHLTLYRTVKLIFPRDIGELFQDGTINIIRQVICAQFLGMFVFIVQ